MEITSITRQARNKNRVSIFVDGKYSFSLSEAQLVSLGLQTGQKVDKSMIEDFKEDSEFGKVLQKAVDWAIRRHHSHREIHDYIAKKTNNSEKAEKLEQYLNKLGFIDDQRYADWWVEMRRKRGYSTYVIKRELFRNGIAPEIINPHFEDRQQELEAIQTMVDKKSHLPKYQDRQKFMTYLAQKGFNYGDIKEVLEEGQD